MGRYLTEDQQSYAEVKAIVLDVLAELGLIDARTEEAADDEEEAAHVAH